LWINEKTLSLQPKRSNFKGWLFHFLRKSCFYGSPEFMMYNVNTSDSFATGTGSEHSAKKSLEFSPKIKKKALSTLSSKNTRTLKNA
jgi:hypothetical protein